MKDIVILEGDDLKRFLEHLESVVESKDRVYRLRFAVDGGVKFKVNEYVWSPPYGEVQD